MKLRDTFLGSTIGLVTIAFIALAAMLYTVYTEEMRQRAHRHIEETRALLVEHINARTGAIIDGLETVYRPLHDTLRNLDRRHANTARPQLPTVRMALPRLVPAMNEIRRLARAVGEEYARIALYDGDGTLLLLYGASNQQELTLSAYLPEVHADRLIVLRKERKLAWRKNAITAFDERNIERLDNGDTLETLPMPPEVPARIDQTRRGDSRMFAIFDGVPALRLRVPLVNSESHLYFANADDRRAANDAQAALPPIVGTIDVTLQFSDGGIAKIAATTHTQINTFVNERLVQGTLSVYDRIALDNDTAVTLDETLSIPPVAALQSRFIDGVSYYESRMALRGDFSDSLILSILESRATEEKSVAAFSRRIAVIALLFGAVFSLIIYLFNKQLVSPIVRMQEIIRALAKGAIRPAQEIRNAVWISEIRNIQDALVELVTVDRKIAELAGQVADNNFDNTIEPRSENDVMLQALNRMVARLHEQQEQISQSNKELRKLANTDGLTGIYNRRYFDQMFEYNFNVAQRNKIPIAVLIIDIDHFKKFNDHFGHQGGDDCLIAVANTLLRCAKRKDDIVARYGGEEFVIVSVGCNPEQTRRMAEVLCHNVALQRIDHPLSEHSIVTVSVGGCSMIPQENLHANELLKRADEALYLAKSRGRNRAETVA